MSNGITGGAIAAGVVLSVLAGLGRLVGAGLVKTRLPGFYAWFTSYRGHVARWSTLATVMLAGSIFVLLFLVPATADPGNCRFLFVFAGFCFLVAAWFAIQIPRELRQALLEGRRRPRVSANPRGGQD